MMSSTSVITAQALGGQGLSPKVYSFPAVRTSSTTTSDSSLPIISVESVDSAEQHLLSYLGLAEPLHDLRLRFLEAFLDGEPVRNILRSALQQRRRFIYDRETCVLRVYTMS